jgi:hypothetical protein
MEDPFYIIVDALDEASDRPGKSIAQLLSEQLGNFPLWLKLVATTRRDERVLALFREAEQCLLDQSELRQGDDVRQYILRRLTEPDLGLRYPDEGVRGRLVAAIAERSAGNFQFATTVLDEISRGTLDIGEIDQLPRSLVDLYENWAALRFPPSSDFEPARKVLSVLLAARQPLTRIQLVMITGLDRSRKLFETLNSLSCFVTWDSGLGNERYHRLAHRSIREWLTEPPSASDRFRVDLEQGRELILAHCRRWPTHHEPYALTHLVDHLLEGDLWDEALMAVHNGFFAERRAYVDPRYDLDDTRSLTLALVAGQDQVRILKLAQTDNLWQRDGVAAGLQVAPPDDDDFVDKVVGALLHVS